VAIATLNVHNLAASDPDLDAAEEEEKFNRLADLIVGALGAPDLLVLEEVQDANGNGTADDAEVDADPTAQRLVDAILAAGGPQYVYKDVDPLDDQDGGALGGNIRVGFLFRTDRGLAWVERDPGDATTPVEVATEAGSPHLSVNPGRIAPADRAFHASRKPVVGEFAIGEQRLFVVGVHLASQLGGTPLFARPQPPWVGSATQRVAQAQVVAAFIEDLLAVDADAFVVLLGDFNAFWFSETLATLEGAGLANVMATLPEAEPYTYVFEGNAQALDHYLVSPALAAALAPQGYAIVHANAEFADQVTDHDPVVARFAISDPDATPMPVASPVAIPTATPRAGCT
jgi:predicted extracellular nuclease